MGTALPILTLFPSYFVSHKLGMIDNHLLSHCQCLWSQAASKKFFTELFLGSLVRFLIQKVRLKRNEGNFPLSERI